MNKRWFFLSLIYGVFIVIVIITAYLGKLPSELIKFPGYDYFGHFTLVGFLSFTLHRLFNRKMVNFGYLKIPFFPTLVGLIFLIEEFLQRLSPRREFSFHDMACNFLGIIVFYYLDKYLSKKINN